MEDNTEFFEISAVSRLTGISSHVLRVWERRYSVVEPRRSESKRRMYSSADVQRLALLKTLVDQGHSIGSVANLSTDKLEERLSAALEMSGHETEVAGNVRRIALIGTKVRQTVRDAAASADSLQLLGEFGDLSDFTASLRPGATDVVIYEKDNLFPEHVAEARNLLDSKHVRRVVFIYHFASDEVLGCLDTDGIIALRAPVGPVGIRQACVVELPARTPPGSLVNGAERSMESPTFASEIPARIFSDEQLAKVLRLSSVVKCECPQHVGHLVSGLFAFEEYSQQCEDRNEKDAEIHAFLHRTTANCRLQMENALSRILKEEGITL